MSERVVIIGAGPAGLTAAYALVKRGEQPLVLEKERQVGGIARTEVYKEYRFDIGGHRFFTKVPEVEALWREILGPEFIRVRRLSRIYYEGRYYNYPLEPLNALSNLGVMESCRIVLSYLKWRLFPHPVEETFEQWVMNRFGGRLYARFFKTYTEKVWGIPCKQIRADWAAQRIKGLDLRKAIVNALFGVGEAKTLIKEFDYPRLGPGQMWEVCAERVRAGGGEVRLGVDVVRLVRRGERIESVVAHENGKSVEYRGRHFLSSMALPALVARLDPPAPPEVLDAARRLRHRDFLIVCLIVNRADLFPDNWIYIHSPEVKVGRIQNFKNWSRDMVPDPSTTALGMEYFCNVGDAVWEMTDDELIELARRELEQLGLAKASDVVDGTVVRQRAAYPVYDGTYRSALDVIRPYLQGFENLQTMGRNGLHRYNNQDHSMLCALRAVDNLFGARHDIWDINTERSYHEEFTTDRGGA
ncbi:MAG: NAD(P)/FAD-dependent oxidoreductase [Verrucomicrobiae bacterium]|nr:NAD(P)/FAD-dependent oxidoreductase [Verrucomicrobiae bacterium]